MTELPVENDDLVRGATERHARAVAARLRRYGRLRRCPMS
jgi:hypothetical protein